MSVRNKILGLFLLTGVVACPVGCDRFFIGPDADGDFLETGRTLSFFQAVQVDPRSEDSAGPQFVVSADMNNDGIPDLVSAWNQSQPVQIHYQRRDGNDISFETVTLAGNLPVLGVSGLAVADFDLDGKQDVAVLIKQSFVDGAPCLANAFPETFFSGMLLIYFGPDNSGQATQALAWEDVLIGSSFLAGGGGDVGDASSKPEEGGYTGLAVGDLNNDGMMDLVVSWISACEEDRSSVLVFENLGPTMTRDGTWKRKVISDIFDADAIKDVALADIDRDGDLDIIATRPTAQTMNIRWFRNPQFDEPDDFHVSDGEWHVGAVGQMATTADILSVGDIDQDGIADIVVRSTEGKVIQWFKGPETPTSQPVRSIPWQVFTLAEFTERTPQGIALGDLTGDGQIELIAGAEGGLLWFDSRSAPSIYDQWTEVMVVDDQPTGAVTTSTPPTTDPNVVPAEIGATTFINCIIVTDLDNDGRNDFVVTMDRAGLSGLTNDALVWFRNTR